eukprot:191792_1
MLCIYIGRGSIQLITYLPCVACIDSSGSIHRITECYALHPQSVLGHPTDHVIPCFASISSLGLDATDPTDLIIPRFASIFGRGLDATDPTDPIKPHFASRFWCCSIQLIP